MTKITFEINDELVDSFSIQKLSSHGLDRFEIYLSHRIGSVKDDFNRPLGTYLSGKGSNKDFALALAEAEKKLAANVEYVRREQNARPPGIVRSSGVRTEEDDLFKLLDL